MRILIFLLLACGIWYLYTQHNLSSEPEITSTVKQESPEITCSYCKGMGKLVDDSGDKLVGYRCPICDGLGSKAIRESIACAYCKGFGKTPTPTSLKDRHPQNGTLSRGALSKRLIAQRCPICEGSGSKPNTSR